MSLTLIVLLLIVLGVAGWAMAVYNGLVAGRNRLRNAFAQIDVQLTRRHDLIPNLVEVAKTYMAHERDTLEAVILARNGAVQAQQQAAKDPGNAASMQALAGAENGLSSTLGRLFALSEGYPDLKANQNMMQLSEELSSTENRVAFARQAFNDSVMDYNNRREMFPGSLIAGSFSFPPASPLQLEENEQHKREVPKISF
jgi:LemA protein